MGSSYDEEGRVMGWNPVNGPQTPVRINSL